MRNFDFNQYYQNHEVDLSWLKKPSQHGFRWRCFKCRGRFCADCEAGKSIMCKACS